MVDLTAKEATTMTQGVLSNRRRWARQTFVDFPQHALPKILFWKRLATPHSFGLKIGHFLLLLQSNSRLGAQRRCCYNPQSKNDATMSKRICLLDGSSYFNGFRGMRV